MNEKSLIRVRETFITITNTLEGFKGNFKNHYLDEKANCEGCNQVLDTQGHVVECEAYADIKDGLDLSPRTLTLFYFSRMCSTEELKMRSNGCWGPELGQLSKTFWEIVMHCNKYLFLL